MHHPTVNTHQQIPPPNHKKTWIFKKKQNDLCLSSRTCCGVYPFLSLRGIAIAMPWQSPSVSILFCHCEGFSPWQSPSVMDDVSQTLSHKQGDCHGIAILLLYNPALSGIVPRSDRSRCHGFASGPTQWQVTLPRHCYRNASQWYIVKTFKTLTKSARYKSQR